MRVALTGTPGTGKTTASDRLDGVSGRYFSKQRQAEPSAGPFEPRKVIVDELPLGSAAQAADGSDVKPHAALYWAVPAGIHIFSSW